MRFDPERWNGHSEQTTKNGSVFQKEIECEY